MAIVNSRAAIEPKTGKAAIFVNETIPSLMRKLFSNGEQGFAYDPNDLTTMYQNAAGTVPVTGVGQAVGLIRDKSGRNNHAYQTVSASRPVLTNRVNLFNDSEVFSAWIRNDGVALTTPNPKYPNAVTLTRGASTVYIHRSAMTTSGTYTLTGLFKNVVGTVNAILANTTAVPMKKVGITADGLDIYQATQTINSVPNSTVTGIVLYNANDSVEVYGLDVRVTRQSSTLPLYQKVVGSTQFDAVGFPNYLLFDGVDDKLITNLPAQLIGCTVIRSVPNVGAQILTGQTIPTPYNDNTNHCGLIVINRALTESETSQITKLFNKAAGV